MFARLSARDRRALYAGVIAVIAFVFVTRIAMPAVRAWTARESEIALLRDRVQRLSGLQQSATRLRAAADSGETLWSTAPRRVLRGTTASLAAASLQGALQELAAAQHVEITQLEVLSDSSSGAASSALPATLNGFADVYGIAGLLAQLEGGPLALAVQELSVASTSGMRGNLMQIALTVRAPFLIAP